MAEGPAILVRGVRKCYVKDVPVLNNLNMNVQSGSIYGLLGASGCGKTTLLACVVGIQKKLERGQIRVLGGKPGTKGSGIPGPRVGYMPQEVALTNEFTAEGAIYYFGRINGVEDDVIEERFVFLSNLLQLPPRTKMVKNMSGGQQRRVSFAAALIHEPELLILDEPTVGLDPVLRESIWNHLMTLTREKGTTVVITTHYIDEARMADQIGLMRNGCLLIEASPNAILDKCQCETLEQAFLSLSQEQAENEAIDSTTGSSILQDSQELEGVTPSSDHITMENGDEKKIMERANEKPPRRKHPTLKIYKALLIKNLVQFFRHPGGLLFVVGFPLLQVFLFFNAVGGDPRHQKIAVLNEESSNCTHGDYIGTVTWDEENSTCYLKDLSCRFMRQFQDPNLELIHYPDEDSAQKAIRLGKASGIMRFAANFSYGFQKRLEYDTSITDEDLSSSTIDILLDMGDRQIGLFLRKKMLERFVDINAGILKDCNILPRIGNVPLRFEDPVLGEKDPQFLMFVVPGFIMTVTYFLACAVTVSIIVADRNEGIWDRSLVAGVTTSEILTSHILVQYSLILVQSSLTLGGNFAQSGFYCKGSIVAVIALTFLSSACGMLYGFLISVLSGNHTTAHYVSSGSYYPVFLLCGCIWPIEGMPKFLQWISWIMPNTWPIISIRALLEKGSSIVEPEVYYGFLMSVLWLVIMASLSLLGVKYKTN